MWRLKKMVYYLLYYSNSIYKLNRMQNYELSFCILPRVKKTLEELSRTQYLQNLNFPLFSSVLHSREENNGIS